MSPMSFFSRSLLVAACSAGLLAPAGAARGAGLAVEAVTSRPVSDLVKVVVGCGVSVGDIRLIGNKSAAGVFTGGTGILGGSTVFESGIVLSSGSVGSVLGPNNVDNISDALTDFWDADLQSLIPSYTVHDSTILEFEFIPSATFIVFDYVFGSDEYNEYANSAFNDVFGFFLNGTNVALLPGTATPVSINTVNDGDRNADCDAFSYPAGCPVNPAYYLNNDKWNNVGASSTLYNTEMDGMTVVMPVYAPVMAGQRNVIRIGVADAGDQVYNSWVFIRAGSFSSQCVDLGGTATTVFTSSELQVSPNPFRPGSGGPMDADGVTFSNIPAGATIRLYTPIGVLVAELEDDNSDGQALWNGRNRGGKMVASGVYIFVVKGKDGTTRRGKVMVVR